MLKSILIGISFFILPLTSFGDDALEGTSHAFMGCSGYHQGSYLDFYSSLNGEKIYIEVSGDGEESIWPIYEITSVLEDGETLLNTSYSDVLLKVTEAMNSDVFQYGYVFVTAQSSDGRLLQLNLNNFFGDSFLVIDGAVEPLQCQVY